MDGCALFAAFSVAVVAIGVAIAANARIERVLSELKALRTRLDSLERAGARSPSVAEEPRARAIVREVERVEPVVPQTGDAPPPPAVPAPAPRAETAPVSAKTVTEVAPPVKNADVESAAPLPAAASSTLPPEVGGQAATGAAFEPTPQVAEAPEPPPRPTAAATPKPPSKPFDWESLIGVKLFSWIAGIALVLAAVFALKYSVEHGWVSPKIRATFGILVGASLIAVCEMRFARGYKFTTNALHGAGIAILYATLFATNALWHLLSPGTVFPLMLVVTAVAVFLSIRHDSVFIALLGLLGGFATPALLSTGENRPLGLFSYLVLLNSGLAFVAYRKRWPALTLCSVVLTAIYQWAWIATYLTPAQLPLAAGIFVIFAAIAATALWAGRGEGGGQRVFERTALAGAVLPLMFAVFAAAVPAYGARYNTLFVFLLLVDAGLAVIAIVRGHRWLHVLGGATTLLVFAVWTATSYNAAAWPLILAWVTVFVAGYVVAERFGRTTAAFAAPLLLFMFPTLLAIESMARDPALPFGVLFLLLAALAAHALLTRRGAPWFVGCVVAVIAEGIWSARYLAPQTLTSALVLYAAFALLFIAVPMLGRALGRVVLPVAGTGVVLLLSLALLFFLTGSTVESALGGIAVLLLLINAGGVIEASEVSQPALSGGLTVLSWLVLGAWWFEARMEEHQLTGLSVVCGFALLTVASNWWAARRSNQASTFATSASLALAGHGFLFVVAATHSLSIPPWPLFTALAVLDVAIGLAALYLERSAVFLAAMVASQGILLIWSRSAVDAPWPHVALFATLVIAAMAVIWYRISASFTTSAITALFLGQIVAMAVSRFAGPPVVASLIATQLLLVLAILTLSARSKRYAAAVLAVFSTTVATILAKTLTPSVAFAFALSMFIPFVGFPLLLGKRVRQHLEPHFATVLSSIAFFFFAREAMIDGGLEGIIGVLPLSLAAVMSLVLAGLLRVEPKGDRTLDRLAMVAGSVLAYITVAIPLQLGKEWITVAWALEGAALVWLFRRIPHRGLLLWSGALMAIVAIRLTLNEAIFDYHPRSGLPILNWYLYTYLVSAAAFFVAARLWPVEERKRVRWAVPALNSAGAVLLFFLLNIEIADYFSKGAHLTFNFFSSSLAQDLTYTIAWAAFAIGMLIIGIIVHARSARVAALVLLLVTILKCFLHDLGRLGGLYRVGSLLGLAISLVLVGILLQRFVMIRPAQET
jgi:hypothetical protein